MDGMHVRYCHFGSRFSLSDGFSRPPYPGCGVVGHLPADLGSAVLLSGQLAAEGPGGQVLRVFPARGCGVGVPHCLLAGRGGVPVRVATGSLPVGGAPHWWPLGYLWWVLGVPLHHGIQDILVGV